MAQVDIIRDMPNKQLAPIDPDVKIPDSVRIAAEKANSYYKKKEPVEPVEPVEAAEAVEPAPKPKPKPRAPRAAPAAEEAAPQAQAQPPVRQAERQAQPQPQGDEINWEHRYLSMKGRHDALQQSVGSMQEQMAQMGDELMRTQQIIQQRGAPPAQNVRGQKKLLTPEDETTYGPELIDFARRAAQEAIGPELEASKQEISRLNQRLTREAQAGVQITLDREVPEWRQINLDDRFKQWLRLPNIYSGRVRHQMLSDAYQAANAPLVVQLFRDFIADEEATGNSSPVPSAEPPVPPVPRRAAASLAVLAAPGRAKPAGGDTAVPADKPSFTRIQIKRFYDAVRAGAFVGREVEKDRQEKEIFAAQNEGRVTT